MAYNPVKLFFPVFASIICLSLGVKPLWAMDGFQNDSPRIQKVNKLIKEWEREKQSVKDIEGYFENIKGILNCSRCCPTDKLEGKSHGELEEKWGLQLYYHCWLKKDADEDKGSSEEGDENKGYSGAKIIPFPNKDKPKQIIKKFEGYDLHLMSDLPSDGKPLENKVYFKKYDKQLEYKFLNSAGEIVQGKLNIQIDRDLTAEILVSLKPEILKKTSGLDHTQLGKVLGKVEVGLKDFIHSLMAFRMYHNLGDELKMVAIYDAVICQNPVALSFVMEKAEGNDIHSFMKTDIRKNVVKVENVIEACAQYLGTFHVRQLEHLAKVEEEQGTKYLSHVAAEFYHKLCKKRTQSLQGQNGGELFKLEIGKQIESINVKDFKSDTIIQTLEQAVQETCINYIGRTQRLFEKCSGYVYRALNPCGEGTKRLYWTTITHGDAHRRNFFYNDDRELDLDPKSLKRVTMIDYSSIMDTWGNIGDPAQDVGRFLGSLWDWASEEKGQEGLYSVIQGLQRTFLECYKETVKASLNISDDFENIFIENCNFYKLRYYRTIFNSSKERKSPKSKMQLLEYWMSEMQSHIIGSNAEFANNLLKEKKYYRESKGSKERKWVGATKQVIHNLPEKLTVFIESAPKTSEKSHLTRLWEQLHNGSGVATLLQEGDDVPIADMVGIGKTSLALEYAHESVENRAYNLIWWLCSEQPEISLKQGYEDILVKVGGFSEFSKDWTDLKQLYEDIFFKTKELYNTSSDWSHENQKKEEYSVKKLKAIIESYVESDKCKWLLIYDNARDLVKLKELIPQHKNIHVLVTSRNQEGCENPFCLKVFSPEESVKYLLAETGADTENPDNKEAAQEVAKTLGYLPLALSEAANYVKLIGGEAANSTHFTKYLENPGSLTNPMTDPENRCERFVHTLYEELSKDSEVGQHAIDIMVLCAYLNPNLISEKFFWGTALDQGKTTRALKKLYDASYISVKEGGFSIHCLVQKSTLHKLGTNDKLCDVSKRIEALFYKYVSEVSGILDILTFLPHVLTLLEHVKPENYQELSSFKAINSLQWIGRILCSWYNHPYQYACELWREKQTRKFERILPQAVVNGKQLLLTNPNLDRDPESCMDIENLHPKIYNTLGLIYAFGKYGLKEDPNKGMEYLKRSNSKEDINAPLHIGQIYEKDNDYINAEKYYQVAVDRDNTFAMIHLGKLYEKKASEEKDHTDSDFKPQKNKSQKNRSKVDNPQYVKARKLYEKAIELGNHVAMIHLGNLYENGWGVEKNDQKAMELYKDVKNATAMISLGERHEKNKNYEKALKCYLEAAKWLKNSTAMTKIGWLYQNGWVGKKPHDNKNAKEWYEQGVEHRDSLAMIRLGFLYQNGWGVDKNYEKAMELYKGAAELGDVKAIEAIREIGNLYNKGVHGIPRDCNKSAECFQIAEFYEDRSKK